MYPKFDVKDMIISIANYFQLSCTSYDLLPSSSAPKGHRDIFINPRYFLILLGIRYYV